MSNDERPTFVAMQLDRLATRISDQGEILLQNAGIEFPSRSVSTVLLIGENPDLSTADIAERLNLPHQLVSQRIDLLVKIKIVERFSDPNDGRRKFLKLTEKGLAQYNILEPLLSISDQVFAALFEEIGCHLTNIVMRTHEALERAPISERVDKFPSN